MAKKARTTPAKRIFVSDEIELRRWCIEIAARWPVHNDSGYSNMGGSKPPVHQDEDVIGRANKVLAWVTTA